MKLIVLLESNSSSRTHWWNRQSSNSTASPKLPRSFLSITSLSFRPNLHSGVPDRYALMRMWPSTSARSTVPLALMLRLTVSTTSTNASFFLYFTSFRLQLVAPVAWVVIFEDSSCDRTMSQIHQEPECRRTAGTFVDITLSVVMYVFSVSISLFCG